MPSIAQASSSSEVPPLTLTAPMMLLSPIEAPPPLLSKELKRRWSYFFRKVYETDPLVCPKCRGEMRTISFIGQPEVIIHTKRNEIAL